MPTLTVYPQAGSGGSNVSVDGAVGIDNGSNLTWAQIRVASASFANKTGVTNQLYYIVADSSSDRFQTLVRGIYTFDTSALTAGATITSAILSFYGSSARTDAANPGVQIVGATPANNNNIITGDFAQLGSTTFSTRILASSWNTSGYNDFTLNASGLANINKTGVTAFGTIESEYDLTGTDPGNFSGGLDHVSCYQADNGSNMPKLVIEYTVPNNSNMFLAF